MRRVGIRVRSMSLGAMMVLSATAAAADEPSAAAQPETALAEQAAPHASKDDYYTRRAKSVLEAEKSAADNPHPLAARYPGMDVVVCEAGCPVRKGPEVIYLRKHVVAAETAGNGIEEGREARMVPTSETGGDAARRTASAADPICVAGCYENLAGAIGAAEPEPAWYPSTPPAPQPPRDKLSPIR